MLRFIFIIYIFISIVCVQANHLFEDEDVSPNKSLYFREETCLENVILIPSVFTEVRQNLLRAAIEDLGLKRLESVKCREDYFNIENSEEEKKYKDYIKLQAKNFLDEQYTTIDGVVANTIILINLRAENRTRVSYFTTLQILFSCHTFLDYLDKLAIQNDWDSYSHVTVSVIPKGAYIQGMIGLTAAQESSFSKYIKNVFGEKTAKFYTPRKGGAPQLFMHSVSHCVHYDLGAFSNQTNADFFIKNGMPNPSVAEKDYRKLLMIKMRDSYSCFFKACNAVYQSDDYKNPYYIIYRNYVNLLDFYKGIINQNNIHTLKMKIKNTEIIQPLKLLYLAPVRMLPKSLISFRFMPILVKQKDVMKLLYRIIR